MRKVLFTLIVGAVSFMSFAGNGVFRDLIDPSTGLINADRLTEKYKVAPQGFTPSNEQEVKTILFNGDNKVTVILKDGSKRVFEKDVFHPEKGWRRTY